MKYPNRVFFAALDSLPSKDDLFAAVDFESEAIRIQLQTLRDEYEFRMSEFRWHGDSLKLYDNLARTEHNELMKEKYQRRRDEIHVPDKPVRDWVHEKALEASLVLAGKKFAVEQQKKLFEKDIAFKNKLATKKETQLQEK